MFGDRERIYGTRDAVATVNSHRYFMAASFREAVANRRSVYELSGKSTLSDKDLGELLRFAVKHTPSAYNSQSTRIVLLTGKAHADLWEIVKQTLRERIRADAFIRTERKIDTSFASGYGTVLFFEDMSVIAAMQAQFPAYADRFPLWSDQTNAMHQFVIWTMLEDAGMGASLQHYNPLIDDQVKKEWKLPSEWRLIAQMPFGIPTGKPAEKEFEPLDKRIFMFDR